MKAIVYTSNTGYTKAYAEMLGRLINIPVYSAEEGKKALEKGTEVIYMGWLMASSIVGFKKAGKRFSVKAVCGVGLCETGCLENEARKASKIPSDVPVFVLQGGMDKTKLQTPYRIAINLLTKGMDKKKNRSSDEDRMLELLKKGGNYVSEDNLKAFLEWYGSV